MSGTAPEICGPMIEHKMLKHNLFAHARVHNSLALILFTTASIISIHCPLHIHTEQDTDLVCTFNLQNLKTYLSTNVLVILLLS